jgi:NIPSNAP
MHKLALLLGFACGICALSVPAADKPKDARCYELRTYYAAPGKLDALNARFRNHTMRIFGKHGMVNIGYWTPTENADNRLIYLLGFPSREAAKKSWQEFSSDPDWQKVVSESESGGRLVTRVESVYLTPTDYTPEIQPSEAAEPRLFELRTYTAASGKLEDLYARFREHTCKLFEKHGMTNFGYWTPMDKEKGADNTLIYILAHQNKAAADASWNAFREDPDWVAVKKASEEKAGGSLTIPDGVKSVFMTPTDYSPTR